MDVHRAIEPIPGLGEQLNDSSRRLLVLEEVGAFQALLERVDNGHGRGSRFISSRLDSTEFPSISSMGRSHTVAARSERGRIDCEVSDLRGAG